MPSKAGMWRRGAVGRDAHRPRRRRPRVSGQGECEAEQMK
jgi:hypothetical protein